VYKIVSIEGETEIIIVFSVVVAQVIDVVPQVGFVFPELIITLKKNY